MLPKRYRLDLRREQPFFRFPYHAHDRYWSLYWKVDGPGPLSLPQAAMVVSKKVAPLAVTRNRLKRKTRELLRPLLASLPHGLQLVVLIKHPDLELNLPKLAEQIIKHCQHVHYPS
jgi:ribonuclease P protein component